MKKRILSFLMAVTLLLVMLPATAITAVAEALPSPALGVRGIAYDRVFGGTHSAELPSQKAYYSTQVSNYLSTLNINQATAEAVGNTVRAALRNFATSVDLSAYKISLPYNLNSYTNAFTELLLQEVFYKYDTFMWNGGSIEWDYDRNYNVTILHFKSSDYVLSYSEYHSRLMAVDMAMERMLDGIKGNDALSDVQKALLLHDRLAAWCRYDKENLDYNTVPDESYTAYGILWLKVGVCQGYAETYDHLLEQVGIPSRMASSTALNHIWNIVTIGGQEFYVDVTWDDPTWDRRGQVTHDHFLVSTNRLFESHQAYDYIFIPQNNYFDDWFWTESYTAFQLIGTDGIYYIDNEDGDPSTYYHNATLCQWTPQNTLEVRANINGDTAWTSARGGIWNANMSNLSSFDGILYFNTAKKIWSFDPQTGLLTNCFTPYIEVSTQCITGFTVEDGWFYFNFFDEFPSSQATLSASWKYYPYKVLSDIRVTKLPDKTAYQAGDSYDLSGLEVSALYTDGTSSRILSGFGWNIPSSATPGTKTVTITYRDFTTTFDLTVIQRLTTPKITLKNTDAGISVSWNKVAGAKTYIVYRSVKANGKWSEWAKFQTTSATSYVNKNAKAGKVYRYAVRAYYGDLKSELGKSGSLRRLTTTTAKVSNAKTGCYVSWTKVTGAKTYAVYRSYKKNGKWTDWKRIANAKTTSYNDKSATTGTIYRYGVVAINEDSKSAIDTTGELRRLKAVTTTAKKSGSAIKLTWKAATKATKYAVYRRVNGKSTWTKIAITKNRSYTDRSAKKGVYYQYSVRAVNGSSMGVHNPTKKVKR